MTENIPGLPADYKPGLEDVIAGITEIAEVDPVRDALTIRGYPAHEIAENAPFYEAVYLLFFNQLPTKTELNRFQKELIKERDLSPFVISGLKMLPPKTEFMNALRLGVGLLAVEDPDVNSNDPSANTRKAKRLVAKAATLVAAISRLREGKDIISSNPKLGHAANFLYMLSGVEPDKNFSKILESTLVLYAEHGYNASTFAARVTASTLSDMHSAVISAIGALKGSLHGGANEKAIEMLLQIGDESNAVEWLKDALARKEKIMGFGHRVYRKQDSRAPIMKISAEKMAKLTGDAKLYPLACKLEEAMMEEKQIFPNVDYYSAVAYYLMGLPIETYTPIFAMARMAGWTAHVIEQHAGNRLIRPDVFYNGPRGLHYVPVDKR